MQIDSAQNRPYSPEIEPQGQFDIGTVQVTTNEDGNLKSRKFVVSMTLILVSSLFTALGQMDVDTWMFFTGGVAAAYLGVNLYQKRM